jgi:hypothetical protein
MSDTIDTRPKFLQQFEDGRMRIVTGEFCVSKDHTQPTLAEVRAHMVQGPTLYCVACASRALEVYEALGYHLHCERVDPIVLRESEPKDRQIDLED